MKSPKIYLLTGWGYLSLGHSDAHTLISAIYKFGSAVEEKTIFPGFGAVLKMDNNGSTAFSANDVLETAYKKFPKYHNCVLVHYPNGMYQLFCDDRIGQNDRASIFNTIAGFLNPTNK